MNRLLIYLTAFWFTAAFCQDDGFDPAFLARLGRVAGGTTPTAAPLPLDLVPTNIWAGYSVARKLTTNHTGYAYKVRRQSDDTTQDIGFATDNSIDLTGLETFCDTSDGLLETLYDQYSTNDLTQSTEAAMPKVWSGSLKILPLGDSITWGYAEHDNIGGYRGRFWQLMTNEGYTVVMQGPGSAGPSWLGSKNHAGYSGAKIHEVESNISPYLAGYNPRVVLLLCGANDILNNYNLATAPDRIASFIDNIHSNCPSAKIFLSEVTPLTGFDTQVADLNGDLPAIVSTRSSYCYLVAMNAEVTTNQLSDNIHPNGAAYTNMAVKWHTEVNAYAYSGSPVYTSTGIPALEFDGTDDTMASVSDAAFHEPALVYFVGQTTTWVSTDRLYDGYDINSMVGYMYDGANELAIYDGFANLIGPDFGINTNYLFTALHSNAVSFVSKNLGTNWPTTGTGNADPHGFRFANTSGSSFGAFLNSEVLIYNDQHSATNQLQLKTNINNFHKIW